MLQCKWCLEGWEKGVVGVFLPFTLFFNSSFVVFGTLTSLLVQLLTNHKNTPTETLRVVNIK